MSDLPSGWKWTTIGDLNPEFQNGLASRGEPEGTSTTVLRLADITDNKISLKNARKISVSDSSSRKYSVAPGDVLIIRVNGSSGIVGRFVPCGHGESGLVYCDHFIRMRISPKVADHRFLALLGASDIVRSQIEKFFVSTAGQKTVNQRHLRSIKIPLPPREEQDRIVAVIEEQFPRLDAGVAQLAKSRNNIRLMRTSILDSAISGRLTEGAVSPSSGYDLLRSIIDRRTLYLNNNPYTGSQRPPAQPDTHTLPSIPANWTWATVDQLTTRVVDGVHKKPNYVAEGIPFVTVKNLTAGPGISFEGLNYVSPADHREFCRRANPQFGDLLMSKDGTLGVVRAVRDRREFSIFVSVALMKPVLYEMTDYLELALASSIVQRQMVRKGTGLQHIHLENLRAVSIPLPPIDEQKSIVEASRSHLDQLNYLDGTLRGQESRARRLRTSVLMSAFTGRLGTQESSDESAEMILQRISAEKRDFSSPQRNRARKMRLDGNLA